MLERIRLQNYRGFGDHTVHFHSKNIVVGKNNAGKSTIIEALRIIDIVSSRFKNTRFFEIENEDSFIPKNLFGFRPDLTGSDIDLTAICHRFNDPPAIAKAYFSSGERIEIYLSPEPEIFAVIYNQSGGIVYSKKTAKSLTMGEIQVLPQVSPLLSDERLLNKNYVRSNISTSRSPRHFRNQIYWMSEYYRDFCAMVSSYWPDLLINEFNIYRLREYIYLYLLIRDGSFVSEVSSMGHGLQVWLQVIWFLARSRDADTIILDEPDVYLHADLQRSLIRNILNLNKQLIMSTHSVEVMTECSPEQILVVDRQKNQSKFAYSIPAVQSVLDHMGSTTNLALTRLWSARRLLLIEGDDQEILKSFQDILSPGVEDTIGMIPSLSIGGWGGWQFAIGSSSILKNQAGEQISCYCIFDSDYHTEEEIARRIEDAEKKEN